MTEAGKLRHRITFQEVSRIPDDLGSSIETWTDGKKVWASVEPLQGQEKIEAQQVQASISHRIIIRYTEGIKPDMRISFRGRIFLIKSIADAFERRKQIELLCEEEVTV